MQDAEVVLGVLRERGRRGLPCDELYRQLFNPQLYLLAYGRIYSNQGAMTPGVTPETADGMSMAKIESIIDAMRHERYRFSPVRRIYIPKRDGTLRPLGLPTWSDKLVGEVIRLLLEAYHEPQFSDHSHGYRPGRGCHTALRDVGETWTGTVWFIEGDISDCFGSLDHDRMIEILAEKIHDARFLRLMRNMLTAGYLEDWVWGATYSGAPQGGVVSPVLSNIYLHKLDEFVETVLIPDYTRGRGRVNNPAYQKVRHARMRARQCGDRAEARDLLRRMHSMPSGDPHDPGYRRLRYSRYADDHLLGFIGTKAEAEQIKQRLAAFLRDDLNLEMSKAKTLITHACTRAARYLSYEITTQHCDTKQTRPRHGTRPDTRSGKRRTANGRIKLGVPADVITAQCSRYMRRGKPARRTTLINRDDHDIIAAYGAEYRGIIQYYLPAHNVSRFHKLRWAAETSMLHTLAAKHHSTVSAMAARHQSTITTPHGVRTCFEAHKQRPGRQPAVARFGGIPLRRQKHAIVHDRVTARITYPRKELVTRLRKGRCELCQHAGMVQVHQVRKLADLATSGPNRPHWMNVMAHMRRKTLVVCQHCHDTIHHGQPITTLTA
jgi:group II intron reverse transcriptase/maturase